MAFSISSTLALATGTYLVGANAVHKGTPHGNSRGDEGGSESTPYYQVSLAGGFYWEDLDGTTPTRVGRLESNFLVNSVAPPTASIARTNLNILDALPGTDADACFPVNVLSVDRVYGATLGIFDTDRDLRDAELKDVKLSIPDAFTTNGKSTHYRLFFSVSETSRDISDGIDAALRALAEGDSLELVLDGWILEPGNGKPTNCAGSGRLTARTTLMITPLASP